MTGRTLTAIGAALTVIPIAIATLLARPRPDSIREGLYLLIPVAATVTLVVATWARL